MRDAVVAVAVTAVVVAVLVLDHSDSRGLGLLAAAGVVVVAVLLSRGWDRFLSRRPSGVAEFNRSRAALARRQSR